MRTIEVTPFITGSIADGDALGGMMTFDKVGSQFSFVNKLLTVIVVDDDDNIMPSELWLFDRPFTAVASGAAWGVTDEDMDNVIGIVKLPSGTYVRDADSAVGNFDADLHLQLNPGATGSMVGDLYGNLVARGAATFVTGTALEVSLVLEK